MRLLAETDLSEHSAGTTKQAERVPDIAHAVSQCSPVASSMVCQSCQRQAIYQSVNLSNQTTTDTVLYAADLLKPTHRFADSRLGDV